jgi:hypothetical protein
VATYCMLLLLLPVIRSGIFSYVSQLVGSSGTGPRELAGGMGGNDMRDAYWEGAFLNRLSLVPFLYMIRLLCLLATEFPRASHGLHDSSLVSFLANVMYILSP